MKWVTNLDRFNESISKVGTDEREERLVRSVMEEVAKNCPVELLIRLAKETHAFRTQELRK